MCPWGDLGIFEAGFRDNEGAKMFKKVELAHLFFSPGQIPFLFR